jgi:TonB family protein
MNKQLKQQQSKNAPVQTASVISTAPASQPEDRGAAAALDQRRVAARQEAQPLTQTVAQQTPALTQTQPAIVPPVAAPQVVTIREGDVVDVTELDKLPAPLSPIHPFYPPLAAQQHIQANIILSALISETGEVTDVKILRGDARFGFNEAATRAIRAVRFTPPMKDGKRVKTWRPQAITFQP